MRLEEGFARLSSVRLELQAASFSIGYAIKRADRDPSILLTGSHRVRPGQLRQCATKLNLTYVVRLFAEFEVVVRDYVAAIRSGSRRRTNVDRLVDRVTAIRTIPSDVRDGAHQVREYRNALLHDRALGMDLTFDECKTRLARFLSYLPPRW